MIHTDKQRIPFPGVMKILVLTLFLCGLFGIVYLRSSVIQLEYTIGTLENIKMNQLRERKMLLAEKTSLLSFEKIEASLSGSQGFIMPDRFRVVHVKKHGKISPYRTALETEHMREH